MPYSNNYFTKMKPETFVEGTKNADIFKLNAPFKNRYQGASPRWLFVCSAGLLRSPTGAAEAVKRGINARSCGSSVNYALIPISANLIAWAEKIIFVSKENYDNAFKLFESAPLLQEDIVAKAIVLAIPDNFEYGEARLIKHLDEQLFQPYGPVTQ